MLETIDLSEVRTPRSPLCQVLLLVRSVGEVHDEGKYPMEKFYNMFRKWYVPTKHSGMLPPEAENMLN